MVIVHLEIQRNKNL